MTDHENPGKTTIAPEVLTTVASMSVLAVEGVSRMAPVPVRVNRLLRRTMKDGVEISVEDGVVYLDLYLILKPDVNVREVSRNAQQQVARAVSELIGMEIGHVNIHIEDIDYEPVEN